MKKILIAMLMCFVTAATAACGNSGGSASSSAPAPSSSGASSVSSAESSSEASSSEASPEESQPEASGAETDNNAAGGEANALPIPSGATDEQKAYIETINELLVKVSDADKAQEIAASGDIKAVTDFVDSLKKDFDAMATLEAPAEYAEVQTKVVEFSNAFSGYFDQVLELARMGAEGAQPDAQAQQEAVTNMGDMATKAMNALVEVTQMLTEMDAQ